MGPVADQLNIDTPELVSIEMPLAGIGSRFIAILIDSLIFGAATVLLIFLAVFLIPRSEVLQNISPNWAVGILVLLNFILHWGYFTLFEALNNGRTPGKSVAGIRVIHRSGRAASFVEALARNLVRVIDGLPTCYGVGLLSIFLSRQNQRLGDMVAGTLVVRNRSIDTPHWGELGSRTITGPALAPSETEYLRTAPHLGVILPAAGVAKLTTADLAVLEGFFARRLDMDLATRAAIAERIASAVRAKSGLEVPPDTPVETFLEALAHQLRELGSVRS
jgi:uncharacterized RDD family membrane protein YckC